MSDDRDLPAPINGPKVVDPDNTTVQFVDWVVTGGHFEGVVNIALGTIDHSRKERDEDFAHIVVASRLRMSVPFAARLHHFLGDLLANAAQPEASPPPAAANKLN
ncbi:hypothetical protein [Paracoccus sp. DMF]|uniref:hypothetical protein n=1 Tax=Paracoccus sp. DMF TaxID=400837 RepID=UPI00110020D6|nr:hypothetical protein [Paracoccus sp. DMF]MCV2448893.1 hypothetical protein [Paracoccus sp. DMF]